MSQAITNYILDTMGTPKYTPRQYENDLTHEEWIEIYSIFSSSTEFYICRSLFFITSPIDYYQLLESFFRSNFGTDSLPFPPSWYGLGFDYEAFSRRRLWWLRLQIIRTKPIPGNSLAGRGDVVAR